jgi:hypothetical protein
LHTVTGLAVQPFECLSTTSSSIHFVANGLGRTQFLLILTPVRLYIANISQPLLHAADFFHPAVGLRPPDFLAVDFLVGLFVPLAAAFLVDFFAPLTFTAVFFATAFVVADSFTFESDEVVPYLMRILLVGLVLPCASSISRYSWAKSLTLSFFPVILQAKRKGSK